MSLLVIGSVAFDDIETPFGKIRKALGGSATYFSLAASQFDRPSVVAVVGKDFSPASRRILKKHRIDISGLQQAAGRTFRWGGKYSFDLNNRETLFTELNVFENFQPKLSPAHINISHIFLGNINPKLQLDILRQMETPKLVGLDTMNYWIEHAASDLAKILRLVDVLIINDSEARELTKERNLLKAANNILGLMKKNRTLVIKRGECGLLMFRRSLSLQKTRPGSVGSSRKGRGGIQIFHLPGFPLEDVVDPTGAGDSFAGGFMGYLAKTRDYSWENFKRACVAGSALASFCVEKFGTKRLQEISAADVARRFKEFKKLTHFDVR